MSASGRKFQRKGWNAEKNGYTANTLYGMGNSNGWKNTNLDECDLKNELLRVWIQVDGFL